MQTHTETQPPSPTVAVIGAGTMGAGIAQVAAQHGWTVELMDVDEETTRRAIDGIRVRLDRLVEKRRLTAEQRDAASARLCVALCPNCVAPAELLIEAIVEDLDVKARVLGKLVPALDTSAIIATNTSSLSVTAIGAAIGAPERTCGMHFFNPAPLMKLVEVIAGRDTRPEIAARVAEIAASWGKAVARAADVPGFIVNHVARPYYLEAFRILEDGLADVQTVDGALMRLGGFRMGPFALTDLIGQDVNTATSRSVWEQLDRPPLLTPSPLQESLVADGRLGRKSGRGVYDYGGADAAPALDLPAEPLALDADQEAAVAGFAADAGIADGTPLEQYVVARVLTALILQARHARERGVATTEDIDTALRYGVNYPRGPFEWEAAIGADRVDAVARSLGIGRARGAATR